MQTVFLARRGRCSRSRGHRRCNAHARHRRLLGSLLVYQERLARLDGGRANAAQKRAVDMDLGGLGRKPGLMGSRGLLGDESLKVARHLVGAHLLGVLPYATHLVINRVHQKPQVAAACLLGTRHLAPPGAVTADVRLRIAHAVRGVGMGLRGIEHGAVKHGMGAALLGAKQPVDIAHLAAMGAMLNQTRKDTAGHSLRLSRIVLVEL